MDAAKVWTKLLFNMVVGICLKEVDTALRVLVGKDDVALRCMDELFSFAEKHSLVHEN